VDGAPVPEAERGADLKERNGRTVAVWERGRMVRLIGGGAFRHRRLTLRFESAGIRLYAFSFTSACVE